LQIGNKLFIKKRVQNQINRVMQKSVAYCCFVDVALFGVGDKESYFLWYKFYQDLPKIHRYSLGQRIDTLFVEVIESISAASFLSPAEKHPYVRLAIKKADTLRVLLLVLWETKSLDDKKYIALSVKLDEAGKMLGGWNGHLAKTLQQVRGKQNSPAKAGEK